MTDLNSVMIIGRVTKDAELSYTSGGTAKLEFAIATNRSVKKNDKWEDETSFFNLTLWKNMAESMKQYLTKGQQIAVKGSLVQQRWKDKDGNNRSQIAIVTESIQLIGGKKDGNGNNAPAQNQSAPSNGADFPEDIPF